MFGTSSTKALTRLPALRGEKLLAIRFCRLSPSQVVGIMRNFDPPERG